MDRNLSAALRSYTRYDTRLTGAMVEEHFNHYKDSPLIHSVDAFICSFPASMCQLWIPFNKTIIFLPAHRYNLGRCTQDEWKELDDDLLRLAGSTNPKHVIGAADSYDLEYLQHYTGLKGGSWVPL